MEQAVVSYWRHESCGNKVVVADVPDWFDAWCPSCRRSVDLGDVSMTAFNNPVIREIPTWHIRPAPEHIPRWHASHFSRGSVMKDDD